MGDLQPEAPIDPLCDLILAGTHFPVKLVQKKQGDRELISLTDHGETLETEEYESTGTAFSLIEAADDQYEPALPLIQYPLAVGDTWSWSGRLISSGVGADAKATVTVTQDWLYIKGISHEVIHVVADLSVERAVGSTLKRTLQFWIEPGHGVVQRAFGKASVRQPRDE